jgi:hypothetical protein
LLIRKKCGRISRFVCHVDLTDFEEIYIRIVTLAFNQTPHPRQASIEGRRLYEGDNNNQSEDELSKPGAPGIITFDLGLMTTDLSSQEASPSQSFVRPNLAPREILKQLAESVVPKLGIVLDQEKCSAACSLVMNSIISPVLRKRTLYNSFISLLTLVILLVIQMYLIYY